MEITKEKFNKLNQLDRIEFRQKQGLIKEKYDHNISTNFIFALAILGTLFILISMNVYHMGGEIESIRFFKLASLCFVLAMAWFFIDVLIGLICAIFGIKERGKLIEEYFKVGVRKK